MKAIQITIDEKLLTRFDADEQVQRLGRLAVLRQVAAEYVERRQRQTVAKARLRRRLGKVGPATMQAVCRALGIAAGCSAGG